MISGSTAYLAAEGNGGGCFDGDFAVSLGSHRLAAVAERLPGRDPGAGGRQRVLVQGLARARLRVHAGRVPAGPRRRRRVTWHLLDQSLTDGTLGHWTPTTNTGTTSPGVGALGPHAMATDGSQLFVGGDFTTVNNKPQQGFAIFPAGAGSAAPANPTTAPTVTSTSAGVDSVSFPATWSSDVGTLTYKIFRDGGTTPIATLTATSWPTGAAGAALPGHRPGARLQPHLHLPGQRRRPTAPRKSPASAPVTVASSSPAQTYQQTVLADTRRSCGR